MRNIIIGKPVRRGSRAILTLVLAVALLATAAGPEILVFHLGDRLVAPPNAPAPLRDWVGSSMNAVIRFYGRFPVGSATLTVHLRPGSDVGGGVTRGGEEPTIHIRAGLDSTAATFTDDWVLPHEMIHLALPDHARRYAWFEEGVSTYVEPLVRARAGLLTEREVWTGLLEGLPKGLPDSGSQGLDRDRTWGRTYWGGALFCFLADVSIRRATHNTRSLRDALVGVQAAGGDITVDWPIERTLAAGDKATGTTTLTDLYERLGKSGGTVDLDAILAELGVSLSGRRLVLDEKAPLAAIRRTMVMGTTATEVRGATKPPPA